MVVLNAKLVAPGVSGRLLPPLSCNTSPVPERPATVPPIVYIFVVQAILTLVTLALVTGPLAPLRAQVCQGLVGCEEIATL